MANREVCRADALTIVHARHQRLPRCLAGLDETAGGFDIGCQQIDALAKIGGVAHAFSVALDYAPAEVRREAGSGLLNGPQINPANKSDVVADLSQVDDLLDSLGF